MGFSNKTLSLPTADEGASTADDMDELFENAENTSYEPIGTHAKNYQPIKNLRKDLIVGKAKAANYEHNMIFIDTFRPIGEQLKNLKG